MALISVPLSGLWIRETTFNRLDFPAPFAPIIQTSFWLDLN